MKTVLRHQALHIVRPTSQVLFQLRSNKFTVRGLPDSPVPPHFLLPLPISLRPFPTSRDVFQPRAILRRPSRPSQIIAGGRTASHSLARHRPAWHSSLPIMGGLVLYMVTCIYTLRADQGSLESISKDFPCVRYVVL